jgi:hypothetical protein
MATSDEARQLLVAANKDLRTLQGMIVLNLLNAHDRIDDSFYELVEFNPYAVQYRYDAFDEIGEPLDRNAVIDRVGALIQKIHALID